jgi:hypothetical protein
VGVEVGIGRSVAGIGLSGVGVVVGDRLTVGVGVGNRGWSGPIMAVGMSVGMVWATAVTVSAGVVVQAVRKKTAAK